MWPNGNGGRGEMDAVRQMAKSKGENWGEVERAQLELGKARAAREKRPGRWVPHCVPTLPAYISVRFGPRAQSAECSSQEQLSPCQSFITFPVDQVD
jgi:hypothetical protein